MPIDLRMLVPIFGILLVMIPVTGITVALVTRSLAKVRRDSMGFDASPALSAQVAQLQEEVESLSLEVRELKAAQEFDRKLLSQRSGGTPGS